MVWYLDTATRNVGVELKIRGEILEQCRLGIRVSHSKNNNKCDNSVPSQ